MALYQINTFTYTFTFNIQYCSGKSNKTADAWSQSSVNSEFE